MNELTLGICFLDEDGNVINKRTIGTNWTINMEQDLRRKFNMHIDNEIASILYENLKLQLKESTILEMIKELNEKCENPE